jgi:MscS family membrane protein
MFAIESDTVTHWFLQTYFGIAIWRFMVAVAIIMASIVLKRVFELFIMRWLNQMFAKTNHRQEAMIFAAISHPLNAVLLVLGIHLALQFLLSGGDVPTDTAQSLTTTVYVAFGLLAVWAAYRLVGAFADILDTAAQQKGSSIDRRFVPFFTRCMRTLVLIVGALTILATMNVDVGSLVTGLGIGGIAMALAAQDSLSNVFGSVALLADRSLKVGDWIVVGDKINGVVEEIGLRSTKIRTWPKTLLTIPNKMLANEVIDNWSQMPKRRVQQTIGLEYCNPDQMEAILQDFRDILTHDPGVDQEFFLVHWTEFGAYSLEVMVYYFTKSTAWGDHLACREGVNLKLLSATLKRGISIAYPTQTLFTKSSEQTYA